MSILSKKLAKAPSIESEDDRLVTAHEAARFLGVTIATLAQWRHHHRYNIPYIRLGNGKRGGRCRYYIRDLKNFIREHTVA